MGYVSVGASLRPDQVERMDKIRGRLGLHRSQLFRHAMDKALSDLARALKDKDAGIEVLAENGSNREVSGEQS